MHRATCSKFKHSTSHVHGTEHEDADEEPVAQLEQAVPAAAHVVDRGDPHRNGTQQGHPAHRRVHAPVGVRVYVDGLVHGEAPPVEPDPVHHEEEGVHGQGGEGQVPRDGVVEDGALEGHPEGGPDLAVSRDRDEDDAEVGGGHEPHEDGDHLQPVKETQRCTLNRLHVYAQRVETTGAPICAQARVTTRWVRGRREV